MLFEATFSDVLYVRYTLRFCAATLFDAWELMREQSAKGQDFLISVNCLTGLRTWR